MTTDDLIGIPTTDRDWQTEALRRLTVRNPSAREMTLDQALADPIIGRVVRPFAAQLRREHDAALQRAEREARYGRRVQWNGYGYRPVHGGRP